MQYFNTWSWAKPWATSTEHPSPNMNPDLDTENHRSTKGTDTKVVPDFNDTMGNSNPTARGVRSHITAEDLRENPVIKVFLDDLLEEKMKEFRENQIEEKNMATEARQAQHRDIQEIKASIEALAVNQRDIKEGSITAEQKIREALTSAKTEVREDLIAATQDISNRVHALTQEVAQLKGPGKRTADQISGDASEEKITKLTAEIRKQKKHITHIEKVADEKKKECAHFKDSYQEALDEIEQLRSTGQLFATVDDDTVVSQWEELKCSIRNLTCLRFNQPSRSLSLSPQQMQFFSLVSDPCHSYLGNRDYVESFFQGVIWRFLTVNILQAPSMVWGTPLGKAISGSIKGDLGSAEKYHTLRAHACALLHENHSLDVNRIDDLTKILHDLISSFDHGHDQKDLKSVLKDIITKASELGAIIAQARASYLPVGLDQVQHDATFNEHWMNSPHCEMQGLEIELVIVPALFKSGNSDGENYEEHTVLVKADVN